MPAGVVPFWSLSFMLAITPGADWAYAISAGSAAPDGDARGGWAVVRPPGGDGGRRCGGRRAAGPVPADHHRIDPAGAVYLIWLGINTLARPSTPHAGTEPAGGSWVRQAARGSGISGLNPKVFLLFLALMPQFIDPESSWPVGGQILLLGLVHVATCAVIYTAVGSGARVVLATRPVAAKVVTRVSGVTMTVIGLILLIEQFIK